MCHIMLPYSFYAQTISSFTTNSLNLISSISWWKWNGIQIPRCQSHEWWILVKVLRGIKIVCELFRTEQELTTVYSVVWLPSFWNINTRTFLKTAKWPCRKSSWTCVRAVQVISQNGGQWLTMRLNVMLKEFAFLAPSYVLAQYSLSNSTSKVITRRCWRKRWRK